MFYFQFFELVPNKKSTDLVLWSLTYNTDSDCVWRWMTWMLPKNEAKASRMVKFMEVIIWKKFISKSLHDTALTSSPKFLCPTVRRSRATAMAASWSTTCGSRIRDRNGGSSIADSVSCWLVMTKMADPLSCWHLMAVVVDRDRGGSSWWILVAALDSDCGLYWHPMVDHDRGGSWP